MSNIDKRALREVAKNAKELGNISRYTKAMVARLEFKEAVTPDVVLALLDELEAKDKQISDLKEAFSIALSAAGIDVPAAAGKGEAS